MLHRRPALLVAWMVLLTGALAAQEPVRVTWPLVDFIVLGDTSRVTLLASPNLSTTEGSGASSNLARLTFDPASVLHWASVMRRMVDSMARLKQATPVGVIAPLVTTSAQAYIGIGADSGRRGERFIFLLSDAAAGHTWTTRASVREVDTMLGALGTVAERWPRTTDSCSGKPVGDSIAGADTTAVRAQEQPPELLTHTPLLYPFNEERIEREGRVWLQFVVDREGRPEPGSFCVLLTDGSGFAAAALQWFRAARFTPGRLLGRPVRSVVYQEVRFTIPLHEDR